MENEIMNGAEQVMENTEVMGTSSNNGGNLLTTILVAGVTYVGMRLGEKGIKKVGDLWNARKAAKELVIDETGDRQDVEG